MSPIDHLPQGLTISSFVSSNNSSVSPPTLRCSTYSKFSQPLVRHGYSSEWYDSFPYLFTDVKFILILSTYKHAIQQACWRKAMEIELAAFKENHTWDLVL